ncbi:MAG TPA: C45 family peptidase [Anaerolineae bacterium]|nr:C45 family peptidase [Anaerolineae bacterium]
MPEYLTLTLRGSPYAMGYQHGQQVCHLRPQILAAMEARFRHLEAEQPDGRFEAFVAGTRALLEELDAPLLATIRGQADALSLDFETVLRCDLISFLGDELQVRRLPGVQGCTTWAAAGPATAGGEVILAKNRDYQLDHLPLQGVVRAQPEGGFQYLYISSAGSPGVYCAGMNEAGLAVADTHVYSRDLGPGLPSFSLMMHVLEDHDRVSSAVDYLRSVPRLGRNNLILADAEGHLAVFEGGHTSYGLFEEQAGTLVNTNHFRSDAMRGYYAAVDPEGRENSLGRYDKVSRALADAHGSVDAGFAQRLSAAHDGPLASICCHPRAERKVASIAAGIFIPGEGRMLYCHGLPCEGRFDQFFV